MAAPPQFSTLLTRLMVPSGAPPKAQVPAFACARAFRGPTGNSTDRTWRTQRRCPQLHMAVRSTR
eukprot:7133137-Pyramimonas_sp.AAC.1